MERVIYKKNPLIEVILQIRFPKILALNAEDPVVFQEAIKNDYPLYRLTVEKQQEISFPVNQDTMIPSIIQKQPVKNHNFISKDGTYKINLTSGFISISTVNYTRWENLLEHFKQPLEKFLEIYAPPFFERIGLRYIDAFSRSRLGIANKSWSELISPAWLGAYAMVDEKSVLNTGMDVEYLLDNGISRAKIHAGIGNINNSQENVFVFDSDFIHISNINPTECASILEYLHTCSQEFIQNAITNELHIAMEPEKIE